jgi:hypothetical protein
MIQITNKLTAVIVPEDAYEFHLSNNRHVDKTTIYFWSAMIDKHHDRTNCLSKQAWDIPENKYEIIGTITKVGKFDFECEKYVENDLHLSTDGLAFFKNYKDVISCIYSYETPEESFISLLQSKGISFDELNNQKILILEKI